MQSKNEIEAFVIDMLKTRLPDWCHYHDVAHTLYVMEKAVEIGHKENCTAGEIELLRVAALWHDTGHIHKYIGHEEESCLLAKEYMPDYGYKPEEIDEVCGMIMATKTPQTPHNKLQEIIADADLEYLGTDSVAEKADALFKELQHLDPSLDRTDWIKREVSFLQNHHYFTRFCRENKEPVKSAYVRKLLQSLDR